MKKAISVLIAVFIAAAFVTAVPLGVSAAGNPCRGLPEYRRAHRI